MSNWTIDDIPDLTGKVVLVTGGNSGLGYETVKITAAKGATAIMASRKLERGEKAKEKILNKHPDANIELMQLDLADLESVKSFANQFKDKYDRLDYLFNNAGIMMNPYGTTKQGFELQFGTNHLGHYALTGLLLPVLKETEGSRVITSSSSAHENGYIDFDNIEMNGGYSRSAGYSRSKVANVFFGYELQRLFEQNDIKSESLVIHPGLVGTNLATQDGGMVTNPIGRGLVKFLMTFMAQSPLKGAQSQLRAAFDPNAKGGEYYRPANNFRGKTAKKSSVPYTYDESVAKRLWEVSEEMTGVTFEF